jgi:hypothetical protein
MAILRGKRPNQELLTAEEVLTVLDQSSDVVDLGDAVALTRNGQGQANEASHGRH